MSKDENINLDENEDVVYEPENEEGELMSQSDKLKKLREELHTARKERDEYLAGWQRSRADYINLNKEMNERIDRLRNSTKEDFVHHLIPALDSFDMAFSNKEAWEKVDSNWRNGVEYIHKQLESTLDSIGVSTIGNIGDKFDPAIHESSEEERTDKDSLDHTISAVLRKGYKIGENIIRPAKVKIFIK